jgi:hypothetical protein
MEASWQKTGYIFCEYTVCSFCGAVGFDCTKFLATVDVVAGAQATRNSTTKHATSEIRTAQAMKRVSPSLWTHLL